jgi:hypothetical protein
MAKSPPGIENGVVEGASEGPLLVETESIGHDAFLCRTTCDYKH